MNTILLIVVLIVVLAILILVHEFGHFWIAKRNGIRVDEFGFGFPPRIKKLFTWKGTDFTLNALPFGGFVKIFGENPADPELQNGTPKDSFISKSRWVQAKVLLAGVAFNMLLAWFLFFIAFAVGVPAIVSSQTGLYKHLKGDQELVITRVVADSPAEKSGLQPGDIVTKIYKTGNPDSGFAPDDYGLAAFIQEKPNELVTLEFLREDRENSIAVRPRYYVVSDDYASIGVEAQMSGLLRLPVHKAVWRGATSSVKIFGDTVKGLASIIGGIFVKSDVPTLDQVSGPVGIAGIVKDALAQGFTSIVMLVGIISVNLAVLNLIPFPALDGGRLLIIVVEKIRKKQISPKTVMWINAVGFFVLIGLMIVITISDIIKL